MTPSRIARTFIAAVLVTAASQALVGQEPKAAPGQDDIRLTLAQEYPDWNGVISAPSIAAALQVCAPFVVDEDPAAAASLIARASIEIELVRRFGGSVQEARARVRQRLRLEARLGAGAGWSLTRSMEQARRSILDAGLPGAGQLKVPASPGLPVDHPGGGGAFR